MGKIVVVIGSLAILGGAGYASWIGYGTLGAAAATTRAAAAGAVPRSGSIRTGSPGSRGPGSFRVK